MRVQPQFDRLELKEQVEPERAGERELIVVLVAEFVRQGAQNRKHRRLLAALLFGKQRAIGLSLPRSVPLSSRKSSQ